MTRDKLCLIRILLGILGLFPECAGAKRKHRDIVDLHVRFVATGSSIRSSWAGNMDVYLVEADNGRDDKPAYAWLVDDYLSCQSPLSRELLVSEAGSVVRAQRDALRDAPLAGKPIRTAPGASWP